MVGVRLVLMFDGLWQHRTFFCGRADSVKGVPPGKTEVSVETSRADISSCDEQIEDHSLCVVCRPCFERVILPAPGYCADRLGWHERCHYSAAVQPVYYVTKAIGGQEERRDNSF